MKVKREMYGVIEKQNFGAYTIYVETPYKKRASKKFSDNQEYCKEDQNIL